MLILLALPAQAADIPDVTDYEVETALGLAGANRPELETALDWCQQKPYAMQAMRFVIANSPLADLGKLTGAELIENYELALAARQEYGYGMHYDDAAWAHFVLPLRMSQEPLSAWRPCLYAQLMPLVSGAQSLEDAALIVNAWCGERVRFQQTQRRDQGPLVTLSGGYGRCEELVMLFVCACRAVGVPARQAYCPWWATMDNNHAWAEVLGSDGKWHFTGGCEPAAALDIAWFAGTAKQAPIVISPCFGIPSDTSGMEILRMEITPGARFCMLNSTVFYREVGWLNVRVPAAESDEPTLAPGDYWLIIRIFNYGALREIARLPLDGYGIVSLRLGAGDYMLSTDAPVGSDRERLVTVEADGDTYLTWERGMNPETGAIFHFPPDPKPAAE